MTGYIRTNIRFLIWPRCENELKLPGRFFADIRSPSDAGRYVFPAYCLTHPPQLYNARDPSLDNVGIRVLAETARRRCAYIVLGSVAGKDMASDYPVSVVLGPDGDIVAKVHSFSKAAGSVVEKERATSRRTRLFLRIVFECLNTDFGHKRLVGKRSPTSTQ